MNELALPNIVCISLTDVCGGQHSVEIQKGPLYRVKGFPMSIYCNVGGVDDEARDQDFAFLIYKPGNPDLGIQIISTFERNFPYAMYADRVRKKNIVIERTSTMSVVFHIKVLNMDDSGKYECYTSNKGGVYYGTYSDETTVTGNLFQYLPFSIYPAMSQRLSVIISWACIFFFMCK